MSGFAVDAMGWPPFFWLTTPAGCLLPVGIKVFGVVCRLVTAAIVAARHGLGQEVSEPLAAQPTPSTR